MTNRCQTCINCLFGQQLEMHLYVRVARKRTNICFPIHTERSSRTDQFCSICFYGKKSSRGGCLSSTLARRYSRVPILRYLLLGFRSTGFRSTGYQFARHQLVGYQARSFIRFFIATFISSLWRWNDSLHACICALRGKGTDFVSMHPMRPIAFLLLV